MSTTTTATRPATTVDSIDERTASQVDPLADIVAGTSTTVITGRSPGGLRAPLWRLVMTSDFGPRIHPVLGTERFHRGIDYGARRGTRVRAAAAGTVVWASELGPYGILVVIAHEADLHSAYGHLDAATVALGQLVRAGERIGRVGSTGLATGPHLHFEVRNNGTPANPSEWLDIRPGRFATAADALAARTRIAGGSVNLLGRR